MPANVQLLAFSDSYLTGVAEIDYQHNIIASSINKIIIALRDGESNNKIYRDSIYLFTYIQVHFRNEEQLMEEFKYPSFEEHRLIHSELIDHLYSIIKTERANLSVTTRPILNGATIVVLCDWFSVHVLNEDIKLGDFLVKKAALLL